jgi:hypothetical protein
VAVSGVRIVSPSQAPPPPPPLKQACKFHCVRALCLCLLQADLQRGRHSP